VLVSNDDLVRRINSVFPVVEGGRAEIGDTRIEGVDIRRAIFFKNDQVRIVALQILHHIPLRSSGEKSGM